MDIANLRSISWGLCTGFALGYAIDCFTCEYHRTGWRLMAGIIASATVLMSFALHL